MNKVSFVIGATASGKSFFITNTLLKEQPYTEYLNVYDCQQRVYDEEGFAEAIPLGAEFRCLLKANDLLLQDIIAKLNEEKGLIVEHTLYKAKRRIAYIDVIHREVPDANITIYVISPSQV